MRRILVLLATVTVAGLAAAPATTTGAESPAKEVPLGRLVEGVACTTDSTQTYTLYLPSDFDLEKSWPVLLILDPRGRGTLAAELFRQPAERHGWILLSSNDTRSDGPMEPNLTALRALLPELTQRWPADPFRIYATGFSGTVMVAQLVARETRSLAGLIGVGGRFLPELLPDEGYDYAHFGAAGRHDFNYWPMRRLDEELASRGAPHRFQSFAGRHEWLPRELALQAVEWMEVHAMKEARRELDRDLVTRLFVEDLARGEELEESGQRLAALRHYRAVNRTFTGFGFLKERLEPLRQAAARLEKDPAVAQALKDEERWEAYERSAASRLREVMVKLQDPQEEVLPRRLAIELRLDHLKKQAETSSFEGDTAQRILAKAFTQLSFYLTRRLFELESYRRAAVGLTLATQIYDDRPSVWYNLACALAQSGSRKRAVEALERAVELGFADLEQLRDDPDLEPLHQAAGYRKIIERLGG